MITPRDYREDDIRTHLEKGLVEKVANVKLRDKNEKDPLNSIKIECFDIPPENLYKGIVYFLVSDYKIIKYGGSSAGIEGCFDWYNNMTTDMKEGRFIPNLFMHDQLLEGEKVEIYAEFLDVVTRHSKNIETREMTQKADVAYYKPREKEWQAHFKNNNISIILNRQEDRKGKNALSQEQVQKYKKEYEERKLKFEEYQKLKKQKRREKREAKKKHAKNSSRN